MTTSIATQNPTFHSLSTNVPVGHKQVFVWGDYAGTVTTVTRINVDYWGVTVREARNAFRSPAVGVSATVWRDTNGQFVADYWSNSQSVEAGRCADLRAALGVAIWSTGSRGHAAGRW